MMRLNWYGLEFVGDEGDATYTIEDDGLTGVLDGVGVRDDDTPRPNADGSFDAPAYLTGRSGSISGLVLADSVPEYVHSVRRLTGVPARGLSRLVAHHDLGSVWLDARRVGVVDVRPLVYGRIAAYMIRWFAPDPRWYGESNVFTGSTVNVHHYGNFPASPVIEVVGPRAAYTITGPDGRVFEVTQALAGGQTHRIDMRTGWVYRNDVLQTGVVGQADTWAIPPGAQVPMSISTGVMTVTVLNESV